MIIPLYTVSNGHKEISIEKVNLLKDLLVAKSFENNKEFAEEINEDE